MGCRFTRQPAESTYMDSSADSASRPRAQSSTAAAHKKAKANSKGLPATINETLAVFNKWLVLRDETPILAAPGAVAANLLPGDPVWLGLIGPPSSAKTEILNATSALPYVVQAATLTPAGLLSGTPKKQQHLGAKGGLLRQIGDFGI